MLDQDEKSEWLNPAAAPVRGLLRDLGVGAPARLRPVLAHIHDHAFDLSYSVKVLKSELGIRGSDLMVEVRHWVGMSPWRLIIEMRMAATAELLRATELEVDTVAWCVGYGEAKSLRRSFHSWCDMSPSEFRRQARRAEALAGPPPTAALSLLFWRRLWAGKLEPEAVAKLLAYLERLSLLPEADEADGEGNAFMATLAAGLAEKLEPLLLEEQREAARSAIRCASPHFSGELDARSRAAARRGDLKRSAELALLARDAEEATAEM